MTTKSSLTSIQVKKDSKVKQCHYRNTCLQARWGCTFRRSTTCEIAINSLVGEGICPAYYFATKIEGPCNLLGEIRIQWKRTSCYVKKNCFYTLGKNNIGDLVHKEGKTNIKKAKKEVAKLHTSYQVAIAI